MEEGEQVKLWLLRVKCESGYSINRLCQRDHCQKLENWHFGKDRVSVNDKTVFYFAQDFSLVSLKIVGFSREDSYLDCGGNITLNVVFLDKHGN